MIIRSEDIETTVYDDQVRSGFDISKPICVRVKHIPTGMIAESDTERSQHANRARATELLKEKLQPKVRYSYHKDMTKPMRDQIFVFGSNESGIHGAGSARAAVDLYGAELGVGFGIQRMTFAIPTKDWKIESLPLDVIRFYVGRFKAYANSSVNKFFITRIGCGLAGYKDADIAPMFIGCGSNCEFPEEWKQYLED